MNYFLNKLSLTFLICYTLFSCNQQNNLKDGHAVTIQNTKETKDFFDQYKNDPNYMVQKFYINPKLKQEIRGKNGTIITIPAGCFVGESENIKIELLECYSIQEMIYKKLFTETIEGKLLESDGMIYLNAYNETGDTLKIGRGKITVKMPTKNFKNEIKIFEGIEANGTIWKITKNTLINSNEIGSIENNNSGFGGSSISSLPKDTISINQNRKIINQNIKSKNLINYVFQLSKMGWINCDRYIEGETKPLIVNVKKEYIGASYYLVLKNYNSSAPPKKDNNGMLSFMIPINEPFTIVGLSSNGEDIYFNISDYTGGKSEVDFPSLKLVTRQELTDLLFNKFGQDIWSRPLL